MLRSNCSIEVKNWTFGARCNQRLLLGVEAWGCHLKMRTWFEARQFICNKQLFTWAFRSATSGASATGTACLARSESIVFKLVRSESLSVWVGLAVAIIRIPVAIIFARVGIVPFYKQITQFHICDRVEWDNQKEHIDGEITRAREIWRCRYQVRTSND